MRNILLAAMVTFAFCGLADAKMYKCTDAKGSVTYQERPCAQGTQQTIKIHDNSSAPLAPPPQIETGNGLQQNVGSVKSGSRVGVQSTAPTSSSSSRRGTTNAARKGMSMSEVSASLGNPDKKDDPTYFHQNRQCQNGERRDVWMYHGANGYLGQKITFCEGIVVDVAALSAESKHTAGPGSNRTGLTGGSVTAQKGWSRTEVLEKMGAPDNKKPMEFSGNVSCPMGARVDTFIYAPRGGNLGQTVFFCNDAVVDVKHN